MEWNWFVEIYRWIIPYYDNNFAIQEYVFIDQHYEGNILNKSDYDNTSQWAVPIFKKYVVELEGVIEQLPGELILSYKKE